MNSKKIWSMLLLIGIIFSITHDYAYIVLDEDHHSVQEYISELNTPDSNHGGVIHDIHAEQHASDIYLVNVFSFSNDKNLKPLFQHNKVFLSLNYFNSFKPPIA